MNDSNKIEQTGIAPVIEYLKELDDHLLSARSVNRLTDRVYDTLSDMEYEGLAIKAPAEVLLGAKTKIPLLFTARQSSERLLKTNLADNCFAIAYHWQKGLIASAPCFYDPNPPQKIPMPENSGNAVPQPSPEEISYLAAQTSVEVWNMAEIFDTDFEPGKLTFAVFSCDWASNPGSTTLTDKKGTLEEPPQTDVQTVMDALESFHTEAESGTRLPVLKENGIQIVLDNQEIKNNSIRRMPLHLSLRTQADNSWRIKPLSKEKQTAFSSWPQALAPVSIIISQKGIPSPLKVINKMLPLYSPSSNMEASVLNGFASFDLFEELEPDIPEGRYYVYAMLGNHISEPASFTVLDN